MFLDGRWLGAQAAAFDNVRINIPEPTSLALVGLGLLALARRRRR